MAAAPPSRRRRSVRRVGRRLWRWLRGGPSMVFTVLTGMGLLWRRSGGVADDQLHRQDVPLVDRVAVDATQQQGGGQLTGLREGHADRGERRHEKRGE